MCLLCYIIQSPFNHGLVQQHSPTIDLDADVRQSSNKDSSQEDATKNVQDAEYSSPTTSQASGSTSNLEYSVKVVPPDRKGGYQVHKRRQCKGKHFVCVEELKSLLQKSLKDHVPCESDMNFGYIEPEMGFQGK